VYCLEGLDNPGVDVLDVAVSAGADLRPTLRPDLLGRVVVLTGPGSVPAAPWAGSLYRQASSVRSPVEVGWRHVDLTAIPYYAWANRGLYPMTVWLRRRD